MRNKQSSSNKPRSLLAWVLLYFKGMAMGAADLVPGVSGGTIAFISGIYEELISTLRVCNPYALKVLFSNGSRDFWKHINGNFLLVLMLGIVSSLIGFVKVITWSIETYPEILWAFFSGLVLASAWLLSKDIKGEKHKLGLFMLAGIALAWWISGQTPQTADLEPYQFFFAGSIAICAMVLPGISGSFLLLLMGAYLPLLAAIDSRDYVVIVCFCFGCATGLLCFVHFLAWLLAHYKNQTFSVLVGFLIGSLRLLWPWKDYKVISVDGIEKTYSFNVSPQIYAQLTQNPTYELYCAIGFIVGIVLIVGLYFFSEKGK